MRSMPELPEVETIARRLREGSAGCPPLPGQRITGVSIRWPRHIAQPSVSTFRRKIKNRTILTVQRRGKYLVIPLDQEAMLIHLRMSGDLLLVPPGATLDPYARTVFLLHSGCELRFSDTRKFGKIHLLADPEAVLGNLGPEPIDPRFQSRDLARLLSRRRGALKPLLLSQSFLAGIGNIYADEALHRAGLHPLRKADSLTAGEIQGLWKSMRQALRQGIRNNGASIDWAYRGGEFQNHFHVYQRSEEPCGKCGTSIRRIIVSQRGTYFCPQCQPDAKP